MAGRNAPYDMTYLTAPVEYRTAIADVDPSPLVDASGHPVPEIRVDIDACKKAYDQAVKHTPKYEVSARGYNAHLELYVHVDSTEDFPRISIVDGILPDADTTPHANIRVWGWSGAPNVDGRWCLVHEQSVLADTLIVLKNIPNTKYRVTVSELLDMTVASIVHQHTV